MPKAKSHLPEGLHTITAHIQHKNSLEAIEFYKKAFGAEVVAHSPGPTPGSTIHADIKIGDSRFFLADDSPMSPIRAPGESPPSALLSLYVPDCDAVFNRAVAAGAKPLMPPADMFWGDRYSQIKDPGGHVWAIGTHVEDVSREEAERRGREFFEKMAQQGPPK